MTDSESIIERLSQSFHELQEAINQARLTINAKNPDKESFLTRLDSYDDILEKQRGLTQELTAQLEVENWDEVSRIISLINALSSMIRDDARAILSSVDDDSIEVDKTVPAAPYS